MSDVKRLLDEATPLPWEVGKPSLFPAGRARLTWNGHELFATSWRAKDTQDADLIVHAVNRLPDYERLADLADEVVAANGSDDPLKEHRLDSAIRQLQIGLSALRGDA